MDKPSSKPQDPELDDEALGNLARFFDVLIEIDLSQKNKQQAEGKSPSDQSPKKDKKTKKKRDK